MPSPRQFEPRSRLRDVVRRFVTVVVLSLALLATAAGVARAADPISAADDQYQQQPVLTPPTPPAPQGQTPAPSTLQTPPTQGSTPPAQTPQAAPPASPTTPPTTPAQGTTPPPAPKTKAAPKAPFTPPQAPAAQKVPLGKPQATAAPATPAGVSSGPTLPFTGISLLYVVLVGAGLILLGAVLRRPSARRH